MSPPRQRRRTAQARDREIAAALASLEDRIGKQRDLAAAAGAVCRLLAERVGLLREGLAGFRRVEPPAAPEPELQEAAAPPPPLPPVVERALPVLAPPPRIALASWRGFRYVEVAPFRPNRGVLGSVAAHLVLIAIAALVRPAPPPPGPSLAAFNVVPLVDPRARVSLPPVESTAPEAADDRLPVKPRPRAPTPVAPGMAVLIPLSAPAPVLGPYAGPAPGGLASLLDSLGALAPPEEARVRLRPRPREDHGIILSSPGNLIPEGAGTLEGGPHYAVYVEVEGSRRKWLLEYVAKNASGQRLTISEDGHALRVSPRQALDPPFPTRKLPLLLSPRAEAAIRSGASRLVVFFSLDEQGRVGNLRVLLSADDLVDREVLENLSGWEFLPAFEGETPAAADVVLGVALQLEGERR